MINTVKAISEVEYKGQNIPIAAAKVRQIIVAELPGTEIGLSYYEGGTLIAQSKTTTGGAVVFEVTEPREYTVSAGNDTTGISWSTTVDVGDVGQYVVKVPDSDTGYALNRYTLEQIHEICQGGYFSTMFDVKFKYNFQEAGSIFNDYDFFVEEIEKTQDGKEAVFWRMVSPYQNANYDIDPHYSYLSASDSTSWSNTYSSSGGYKYSYMRQRMMLQGEDVYIQRTSIKPDDSAIEGGIPFSQLFYSDTGERAYCYTYQPETDTFTQDATWEAQTSYNQNNKFMKGYFLSVGAIDEATFNAGKYYTYSGSSSSAVNRYGYNLATTWVSGTAYYGFYEKLQANGIFYNALSSFHPYMQRLDDKASTGLNQTTTLSTTNDYVDIPCVEEITGVNRYSVLWSKRNASATSPIGSSIYAYNIVGEGTKRTAYDAFDMQATGYEYWTRSVASHTYNYFCYISNYGYISNYYTTAAFRVRVGFQTI